MQLLQKIIGKIENIAPSLQNALLLFATSIFVRTFFENFTNSNNAGFLNSAVDTFIHYPLWYAMVFLSIIIIVYTLTKQDLKKVTSLVAVGSFIILLPPTIDILTYGFLGHPYNFIIGDYGTLWKHFSSLMFTTGAIGIGIKIEIILATIGIGSYIYIKTKHLWKGILGGLLTYTAIFIFLTLPVHTMTLFNALSGNVIAPTPENTAVFFTPTDISIDSAEATLDILNRDTAQQRYFSQKISLVFVFIIWGLLKILAFVKNRKKYWAMTGNMRPYRLFHWIALVALGMYAGVAMGGEFVWNIYSFIDILAIISSITFAWLFSVWDNDEADIAIDTVSNTGRPLVQNMFSAKEWRQTKNVFLLFALLTAWLAGYYIFTLIALFLLTYHHYSRKPMRFKKIFILSSCAVPLNAMLAFTAGFFTIHPAAYLGMLPFKTLLGIFLVFFLIENVKNMKDIDGDREEGVTTLATILGKRAPIGMSIVFIIATIVGYLFFTPPLDIFLVWVIGLPITIYFLYKKPFKEAPIFRMYVLFLAFVLLRLWLL